ncbi:MAG: DUF4340 domain-containing protein [Planctomycetes bacterium]|nr:DUF4340 domain-containing protein [Planctomycetota bacterium]
MRFSTTFVLLGIALLLGGFIYLFENKWESTDEILRKREQKHVLEGIGWNDANKLEIKAPSGELVLERVKEPSDWRIVKPIQYPAEKAAIDSVVNTFEFFSYKGKIPQEAGKTLDLSLYGLDKPRGSLVVHYKKDKAEKSVTLKFGEKSAVGDQVYLQVEGNPDVYTVEPTLWKNLDKKLTDWRDRTLARFEVFEVEKLLLGVGDTELELAKKDDKWSVVRPYADRADDDKVRELLTQLHDVRVEEFTADEVKDFAQYGLDKPALRYTVFTRGNEKGSSVAIGGPAPDNAGRTYARNLENETVLSIKSESAAKAKIDPSSLRSRLFCDVDPAKVSRVSIEKAGAEVASLEKDKDGWKMKLPADYSFDLGTVVPFLNKVKDLKVSEFAADAPTDLAPFGLDKPLGKVKVAWPAKEEGKFEETSFTLGRSAQKPDVTYAQLAGAARVVALPKDAAELVERGAIHFRNRSMLSIARQKIVSLALTEGMNRTICVRGANDKWTIEGTTTEPNLAFLEDVLDNLCYLRAGELVAEGAADLAPFGLDKPQVKVQFTYLEDAPAPATPPAEGAPKPEPKRIDETLILGSDTMVAGTAACHARLESKPFVFTVEKHVLDGLKKDLRPAPAKKPEGPEAPKAEPPKEPAPQAETPPVEPPKADAPPQPQPPAPAPAPAPSQPPAQPEPPKADAPAQPQPPAAPPADAPKPDAPAGS